MIVDPFFIDGKRAMISLGPLTETKYCPYSCAFCYVQDGFEKYMPLDDDDIINYLKNNKQNFEIIYISGDTDSFAPPRTERAINLLKKLAEEFDCDILFTTRTVFSKPDIAKIKGIVKILESKRKNLFASISISRYSEDLAFIEPSPIPSPEKRVDTLKSLKNAGAKTILAMRPFLPIVDVNEYLMILEKCKGFTDIALGESFYFQPDGKIADRLFKNNAVFDFKEASNELFKNVSMLFDKNNSYWNFWSAETYAKIISKKCKEFGIIFSMHSEDAIKEYELKFPKIDKYFS